MASGGEDETDQSLLADSSDETSDEEDEEKLNKSLHDLTISDDVENRDGKWLPHHSWQGEKPDPDLKMKDTVAISASYPLKLGQWEGKSSKKKQLLDLSKIFWNFSTFLKNEMQGSINGSREELEALVGEYLDSGLNLLKSLQTLLKLPSQERDQALSYLPPHMRELFDKFRDDSPNDKESLPISRGNNQNKARSIPTMIHYDPNGVYLHFDCEYMLKMFMPESLSSWFDIQKYEDLMGQTQYQMQKISDPNKEKRWIFIPSFRRAKIALLDWPEDDIVTGESTIIILVVRPSEFKEYVQCCGNWFSVVCLPQDEIGAGYPRYWIQKIALRLKLQYIWMVDDSIESFYEYDPNVAPPLRKDKNGKLRHNYRDFRRRKFGLVFQRIEDFVKEADDSDNPIAAVSPRRWNPISKPKQPFVCKPPQGAVYLNLRALSEKNVRYRPELKFLEDMIFGYECKQNGLKVYMDNRVHMKDHHWKHTGARSPSVKNQGNWEYLARYLQSLQKFKGYAT